MPRPRKPHSPFRYFNPERRLIDRQTYKERRTAALAEWRQLAA